ncbi:putative peroxidase [Rosa chinensis]|uniref:peroxidase n=1 Tax=Rosa chinensis TaxID=74649 RepID=A0A2P6S2E5_ROSCH|nr:putative peroxidase [Rosa chinensis]
MAIHQKLLSVFVLLFLLAFNLSYAQNLKVRFYHKTCPNLEAIVAATTNQYISRAPTLAAPLLRMHFHDCFVRGCDGSVLINSTASNQAEKANTANLSLRGFHVIDAVKSAVRRKEVSRHCFLCRYLGLHHGAFWQVPTGRRDGRVSLASEAARNLPPPFANITQLKAMFSGKGLSVKDLAVLSGGHTIGTSHCGPVTNRLYNFTGRGDTDPSLDKNYIAQLKIKCKPGDITTTILAMDPGSFKTFDEDYYTVVSKRRGLFQSDHYAKSGIRRQTETVV